MPIDRSPAHPSLNDQERALVALGLALRAESYAFICVTPDTHARVLRRPAPPSPSLRDIFGWSLPFERPSLPPAILQPLIEADALAPVSGSATLVRSRVRFSTLRGQLYVHSAYPTTEEHAVFFGPDTYRFCALLQRHFGDRALGQVVDLGSGSGAGGLSLAAQSRSVVLADINEHALSYSRVNAALAQATNVASVHSDLLAGVSGPVDVIVANPPYLVDGQARVYRHGGGDFGTHLSERITGDALARLSPGGTLVLYTGAPIVDGADRLRWALDPILRADSRCAFRYEELDPDIFGDELDRPAYAQVERIAAVALIVTISANN